MPLPPDKLLPSRLESWLTLLGDFSKVESAEPLKPPRRLLPSSLFRPRNDKELALLNTFFTACRGGEVTGKPVAKDSIAHSGEADGAGVCAARSWNYAGIGIGCSAEAPSMPRDGDVRQDSVACRALEDGQLLGALQDHPF